MLSTRDFYYDKETKTFSQEVSTLGKIETKQVYPDACDVGITLVSHVTGVELEFVEYLTRKWDDGEIVGWEFRLAHAKDRMKYGNDLKVLIIND